MSAPRWVWLLHAYGLMILWIVHAIRFFSGDRTALSLLLISAAMLLCFKEAARLKPSSDAATGER